MTQSVTLPATVLQAIVAEAGYALAAGAPKSPNRKQGELGSASV